MRESWAGWIGSERGRGQPGNSFDKKKRCVERNSRKKKRTQKWWAKINENSTHSRFQGFDFEMLISKLNFKLGSNYLRFSNPPNIFKKTF